MSEDPGEINELWIGHNAGDLVALDRKLAEIIHTLLSRQTHQLEPDDRVRLARYVGPLEFWLAQPRAEDPGPDW